MSRTVRLTPRGPIDERREAGFTLIELIVAITVLAVIITPLASAMILGLRVTDQTGANLEASINRDIASNRWAADVAAVDATGVSYAMDRACGASGGGDLYVTLNSTRVDDAGTTQVNRVSYWVTGTGPETSFIRRECSGPLDTLDLSVFKEFPVAEEIGTPAYASDTSVVPALGPSTTPCDEFSCGANLNGRYPLNLRAQRRVFGAGTPLEVGRLYSSAYSRQGATNDRYRYSHVSTAGVEGSPEAGFGGQLSLAPGLDDENSMLVEFKVLQETTGNWLVNTGTADAPVFEFTGTTEDWVEAVYTDATETWAVELPVGTEAVDGSTGQIHVDAGAISAGGEYRVYTRLTELSDPDPKTYGGVAGYPLWFDWIPDDAVFVSTTGSDAATGLPNASGVPEPVATLTRAAEVARDSGRPEILVQNGDYTGTLTLTAADNNRTIQGGMLPASLGPWLRSGPDARWADTSSTAIAPSRSRLDGGQPDTNTPPTGMVFDGATGIQVRQMEVGSHGGVLPPPTDPLAYSTFGIRAVNAASFEAQNSEIIARQPFDVNESAPPPTSGGDWVVACGGTKGAIHSTATNTSRTSSVPLPSGAVAEGGSCNKGSRNGGNGGGGGSSGGSNGASGSAGGSVTDGGSGGAGGAGGIGTDNTGFGNCDARDSSRGGGGTGGHGGGQAPAGYREAPDASAAGIFPGYSNDGLSGTAGGGGGGSGGGGGNGCWALFLDNEGRQGASGGNGGRGGDPGGGGLAGGSAVALYLHNAGAVTLEYTGVFAAGGGDGQPGGEGQRGGNGGPGGRAEADTASGGESAGGGGGGGGGGGSGGNGGNGGDSVGIMLVGSATAPLDGTGGAYYDSSPFYFISGPGGSGGEGGPVPVPLAGGVAGGGAGGEGGRGDSDCLLCFTVFNFPISIGATSGDRGQEGGGAASAAAVGRTGEQGASCHIWQFGTDGGACAEAP